MVDYLISLECGTSDLNILIILLDLMSEGLPRDMYCRLMISRWGVPVSVRPRMFISSSINDAKRRRGGQYKSYGAVITDALRYRG